MIHDGNYRVVVVDHSGTPRDAQDFRKTGRSFKGDVFQVDVAEFAGTGIDHIDIELAKSMQVALGEKVVVLTPTVQVHFTPPHSGTVWKVTLLKDGDVTLNVNQSELFGTPTALTPQTRQNRAEVEARAAEIRRAAERSGDLYGRRPAVATRNRDDDRPAPSRILLLDLDGPVADFDAFYFERCAEAGIELDCDLAGQRHRFAEGHIIDEAQRPVARKMVEGTRWFRQLPLVDGAKDGVWELAEHFDVWLCTKPLEANPWCRDDKAWWVARHLGEAWVKKLIITPDKSLVRGDVLLDDAPHEAWYDRAAWEPIIFTTPWNQDGSKWEHLPHWTWSDGVEALLAQAKA